MQRIARNISRLIEDGVENEVKRGKAALERVSTEVQRAISNTLPRAKQQLRSAGKWYTATPFIDFAVARFTFLYLAIVRVTFTIFFLFLVYVIGNLLPV